MCVLLCVRVCMRVCVCVSLGFPQAKLEAAYRVELREAYGVEFSNLLALNNLPVKRFAEWLQVRHIHKHHMTAACTVL